MAAAIITTDTGTIIMTEAALVRLMSWLSPVFPTGSFAYSAGLEQAVACGLVAGENGLQDWLETQIRHGTVRNEAILLAAAWRKARDPAALTELSELAEALAESAARHRETMNQGRSFLLAAVNWSQTGDLPQRLALPVAVGAATARSGLAAADTLAAFLNAWAINQIQAAIRLSVTGQSGAAHLLAALEPLVVETGRQCAKTTLDDLGGGTFNAAISAMNQETLEPRLFLS